MPSTKDYLDFILDQLSPLGRITTRLMMGEYLLYRNGLYFGAICDNRLLLKKTKITEKYGMKTDLPYPGAKPMYLAECVDDSAEICEIVTETCRGLKEKHS